MSLIVSPNFHRLQSAFFSFYNFHSPLSLSINGELSGNWMEDSLPSIRLHNGYSSSLHSRHWWLSFSRTNSLTVLSLLHILRFSLYFLSFRILLCISACLPLFVFIHNRSVSVVLFMYLVIVCVYFRSNVLRRLRCVIGVGLVFVDCVCRIWLKEFIDHTIIPDPKFHLK